ncbi:MAG: DUF559 domain-containing protein [Pseudomonadota bacterium]
MSKKTYQDLLKTAQKATKLPQAPSVGEETLATHLKADKIAFQREFYFYPTRKWRVDFLLTGTNIIVEVEGMGRHQTDKGFEGDCHKYNRLTIMGYTLLRYTTELVKSGVAIAEIQEILKARKE